MKRLSSILLSVIIFAAPAAPAFAWGEAGHQTVGKIASLRIRSETAREIAQILSPGETLASIATWADTVKQRMGQDDPDPDTRAFLADLAHNEKNREWHYDNLPLNCKSYQSCAGFKPENDVVHMINVCIRTLQGHPDSTHPLSKRNALRLLVHFAGDIHQPLHVGSGYIEVDGPNRKIVIARDPLLIRAKRLPSDKGGNDLIIDNDRKNLHSFWDFTLVTSLMTLTGQGTSDALGQFLRAGVKPQPDWKSGGAINTWAAQWATDSLNLSRAQTYRSIQILGRRTMPVLSRGEPVVRGGQPIVQTVYDISRPGNYEMVNRELVRQQLAKAGFRLAKLLDAIYLR